MIEIEVKVDTSRFDRMMSDFPAALARAQRVALNQIGNTVKNHATDAFKDPSLRPEPWPPRKDRKKHPLLIRSGSLWRSIRYRLEGADTVVVGTDRKYAPYHQHGTKNMPARPFFPVDRRGRLMPDVMEAITRKAQKAYDDELGRLFGAG